MSERDAAWQKLKDRLDKKRLDRAHVARWEQARISVACVTLEEMFCELWGREQEPDMNAAAIAEIRSIAKDMLGGNCSFVDDDYKLLASLAKRAIDAGLIDHLHPSIQAKIKPAEQAGGG